MSNHDITLQYKDDLYGKRFLATHTQTGRQVEVYTLWPPSEVVESARELFIFNGVIDILHNNNGSE